LIEVMERRGEPHIIAFSAIVERGNEEQRKQAYKHVWPVLAPRTYLTLRCLREVGGKNRYSGVVLVKMRDSFKSSER